jgi:hypothetical protein
MPTAFQDGVVDADNFALVVEDGTAGGRYPSK